MSKQPLARPEASQRSHATTSAISASLLVELVERRKREREKELAPASR